MTERKKLSLNFDKLKPELVDKIKAEQQEVAEAALKADKKNTHEEETKKSQELKKQQQKATWKFLQARFPKAIRLDSPLPLKTNIHADIFEDPSIKTKLELGDFNKTAIRDNLTKYCRSKNYHLAVMKNDKRYDLQGNPVEDISEEHKQRATEIFNMLSKRKK